MKSSQLQDIAKNLIILFFNFSMFIGDIRIGKDI